MKEGQVIDIMKGIFGAENVHRFTPGPYTPRGVFDTMVNADGFNYWVEVKMNDTVITENQKRFGRSVSCPVILRVIGRANKIIIFCERDDYAERWNYPGELWQIKNIIAAKMGGVWSLEWREVAEVICHG